MTRERGAEAPRLTVPRCALQLLAGVHREFDVADEGPDLSWGRLDVDLGHHAEPVLEVDAPVLGRAGLCEAPSIEVGDLLGRTSGGGLEFGALRVGDRKGHDRGDAVGDAEDAGELVDTRVEQGCPRAAEAARTQCEVEAPRGLDHRVEQAGTARVVVDAPDRRDDERRRLGEILHQVGARAEDLLLAVATALEAIGHIDHELAVAGVDLAELALGGLVLDHDPPATCVVAATRCLLGQVDAIEDHAVWYVAIEVESLAYRAGRGEEAVDLVEIETGVVVAVGGHRDSILHQPWWARAALAKSRRSARSSSVSTSRSTACI